MSFSCDFQNIDKIFSYFEIRFVKFDRTAVIYKNKVKYSRYKVRNSRIVNRNTLFYHFI